MPKLQFKSNVKPSQFAYPSPLKEEKEKEKGKVIDCTCNISVRICAMPQVSTAILSVTAKAQAKSKKKEEESGAEAMEVCSLFNIFVSLFIFLFVCRLTVRKRLTKQQRRLMLRVQETANLLINPQLKMVTKRRKRKKSHHFKCWIIQLEHYQLKYVLYDLVTTFYTKFCS